MVTIQLHNVVGVFCTKAKCYASKRDDGTESAFWSRCIEFVMSDGSKQSISIFGETESDIKDREFDASAYYAKIDSCIRNMKIPPVPE